MQAPQWPGLAADVRAGQMALFAQEVDEQRARVHRLLDRAAVDLELDDLLGHEILSGSLVQVQRQRAAALRRARLTIWPVIAVLYSRSPRRSSPGSAMAMAALAAASSVASVSAWPNRAASASGARRAVGATLVSAMRTGGDLVRGHAHHHGGAGRGPVARLALELLVGPTGAWREGRDADLTQDLVFREVGQVGAEEKFVGLHAAAALRALQHQRGVERDGDGGMIVAGVAVRDVAADGAAVAHLRVTDELGRVGQQRQPGLQQG